VDLRIGGRRALVTGSSSGIGYAMAEALARKGAQVVLNGRSKKNMDAAVSRLKKAIGGAVCKAVVADASTANGAQRIVAAIPEVDILVNNLGKYERKGFFDTTDRDWMDFYELNVLSGIRLVRAYGQGMRDRKWGRILFLSSESGLLTPVGMINYGFTKTAQAAMSRGLAREFGGCGVTVNEVLLGPTRTEGISTMLANESKRTGMAVRKLEQEFFTWLARLRSSSVCLNPKKLLPWLPTHAAIWRVRPLALLCGSKAASSRGSVENPQMGSLMATPHHRTVAN
jgi:NAD(P)-dependent dehydrogenase (short-subunit alcohol dehydrogenase family)